MPNTELDQNVELIHKLTEMWGVTFGLKRAHAILGTRAYHEAYGSWEREMRILDRHKDQGVTVTERKTK